MGTTHKLGLAQENQKAERILGVIYYAFVKFKKVG